MADYSQSPTGLLRAGLGLGYVGVHVQQGVPILDRDLNLLNDLVAAAAREVFTRYIGNGNATGDDGFAVRALPDGQNSNNFTITAGACLVDGIQCVLDKPITYQDMRRDNPALDDLHTPTAGPRTDCVYLDVTLVEVDGKTDHDLQNSGDIGIETSVRVKPLALVKVHEGSDQAPVPPPDHHHHPLALLRRPAGQDAIDESVVTDIRQRRLTASDMEKRIGVMERLLATPSLVTPEFTPRQGKVNQEIAINGEKLDLGAVEVFFGDQKASIVANPAPTALSARVPPGLTPNGVPAKVPITVRNEVGEAVSQARFTVTPDPVLADPGVQFSPVHGAPDALIDIPGFNLDVGGAPTVAFAPADVPPDDAPTGDVVAHSPALIQVKVPQHLVPTGETSVQLLITVKTQAGSVTSKDFFTAELPVPAPVFADPPFSHSQGVVGDIVTINGIHFDVGSLKVFFGETGGVMASLQGAPSATQVVVAVPEGLSPGDVKIRVETRGGSAVSPQAFTVTATH